MEPDELRRFMAFILAAENGCWTWTSSTSHNGYPMFWYRGKPVRAHRLSYEHFVGEIPKGLTLDHVAERGCVGPACVNPLHLEAVPLHENILRGVTSAAAVNARRTRCASGHLFDAANTRIAPDGKRRCRACERNRERERGPRVRLRRARPLAFLTAAAAAAAIMAATATAGHHQPRLSPQKLRALVYRTDPCLAHIIDHEDGAWDPTVDFGGGHGNVEESYGLGQADPGTKMAPYGADWRTNPWTQIRWARAYARKYGGTCGAWAFWQAHSRW